MVAEVEGSQCVRETSVGGHETAALRIRRLELDRDDLRAENDRLKRSAVRHQEQVDRYAARLAGLERRLARIYRVAKWTGLHGLMDRCAAGMSGK